MSIVRRAVTLTVGLLTVALAAAVIYLAVSPLQAKIIMTGSMKPHMPPGTIVLVQPQHAYHKGEVISFTNPFGHTVTHRLVGVQADGRLVTKGDANDAADGWRISPTAVQGQVVGTIPYLGRVKLYGDDAAQRVRLYFAGIRSNPWSVIPLLVFAAGALLGVSSLRPRATEEPAEENRSPAAV
jgi:signal peptidase